MYALRVQIESRSGGKPSSRKLFLEKIPYDSLPCVRGEQALSCLSGLPQRFCAAKALWDNFRAPAKIAWRVLREEERQAYQVMRQTKRAADPNALPRRGVALTTCELGNAPLFGAFPDRGGVSLAPPRRWLAEGKTEGLLILPAIPLAPPVGVSKCILDL